MSNEQKFNNLLYELRRNYPQYPSTFGVCSKFECNNSARGSGRCASCIADEIAELLGDEDLAMDIHKTTMVTARVIGLALDILED